MFEIRQMTIFKKKPKLKGTGSHFWTTKGNSFQRCFFSLLIEVGGEEPSGELETRLLSSPRLGDLGQVTAHLGFSILV